jgi:hypothetical protein
VECGSRLRHFAGSLCNCRDEFAPAWDRHWQPSSEPTRRGQLGSKGTNPAPLSTTTVACIAVDLPPKMAAMARQKLKRHWTAEEDALLLKMIDQGSTSMQVALRLRRNVGSVHARHSKLTAPPDTAHSGERDGDASNT